MLKNPETFYWCCVIFGVLTQSLSWKLICELLINYPFETLSEKANWQSTTWFFVASIHKHVFATRAGPFCSGEMNIKRFSGFWMFKRFYVLRGEFILLWVWCESCWLPWIDLQCAKGKPLCLFSTMNRLVGLGARCAMFIPFMFWQKQLARFFNSAFLFEIKIVSCHQLVHQDVLRLLIRLFERNFPELDTLVQLELKETVLDRMVSRNACSVPVLLLACLICFFFD